MTNILGILALFLCAFIWGFAFIAQSTGMDEIGALGFVAVRFSLGALTLLPFAYFEWRKTSSEQRRLLLKWVLILAPILFIGAALQQFGLQYTSVTNAGFLTTLYVPIIPIALLVLFKAPPHWVVWPAAALSFLGTYLISGGALTELAFGDYLQILGAFFWAGHIIAMGYAMQALPRAILVTFGHFAAVAIIAGVFTPLFETFSVAGALSAWPELAFTGILSSGVAFFLQAVGQKVVPAGQATLIMSMEAVFAALGGFLILGEVLPQIAYVGCLLIFIATLMVQIVPAFKPQGPSINPL